MGYPMSQSRTKSLANDYVSIALKNYSEMKEKYETLRLQDTDLDAIFDYNLIYQKRIIATGFSQMAIEAFVNDYAAACLGDNEFYDNFDKLSVDGKLQLVSTFIINDRLNKNSVMYANIKALKRQRNEFIHSKSYILEESEMKNCSMKEEEYYLSYDERINITYKNLLERIKDDLDEVKKAVKALIDIANYFDSHDENVLATLELFGYFRIPDIIKEDLKEMGLNYNEI
jgi:hypothetical protein